eukprot:CAMPEP_0172453270 /NCGR_PEP_ID=MMETSP1065-20121228/10673_1 /TAXON_ID=265537 /ORGANISM="Amphiprora paludosa, Strain CCMP125" /LENGTH=779 /DNA_ID=CAMNT_0013205449 /DNA_START=165 /DNA_END=2504 /DNA_ORIENTATION=+
MEDRRKKPPPEVAMAAVEKEEATTPASSATSGVAAAAATTASDPQQEQRDSDRAMALRLLAMEQLTSVFGFPEPIAQQAMDAVGLDVTKCYNYILDQNLAQDGGGPVVPIDTCPHLKHHVKLTVSDLGSVLGGERPQDAICSHHHNDKPAAASASSDSAKAGLKEEMEDDGSCPSKENWLCLECGVVRCSRYQNGHAIAHWEETQKQEQDQKANGITGDGAGHCVGVSLSDLSAWCHVCSAYVKHPTLLNPLVSKLEEIKFQDMTATADLGKTPPNSKDEMSISNPMEFSGLPPSSDNSDNNSMSHFKSPKRKKAKFVLGDNSFGDNSQIWMEVNPLTDDNQIMESEPAAADDEFDSVDGDEKEDGKEEDGGDGDDQEEEALDEVDDADLMAMLARAAMAQGISLDWIMEQARHEGDGDDSESPVEYPFETMPTDLEGVAQFIQSDRCKRVLILAGAGMSVASGIPDFRSADGLYATLQANSLTATTSQREAIREDPSFALDEHLFLENPLPLLETKRDFILGTYEQRWKATLAHRFVELLHSKTGKLVRLYTQNIDGLEDQCTQIPEEKVIPVHGTMDRAECGRCKQRSSFPQFCQKVRSDIKDITGKDDSAPEVSVPPRCSNCGYPALRPAIVLFRSSLPKVFFENVGPDVKDVDLLIVIGTSLKVAPANSLVWRVPKSAMRLLVNRETVGEHLGLDFDDGKRDFFGAGNCDDVLLDLMEHLGWLPELEPLLADQKLPQSCADLLHERLVKLKGSGGNEASTADSTEDTEPTTSSDG